MLTYLEIKNQNKKFLSFLNKNKKNEYIFYTNYFSGMNDKKFDYLILFNSKISKTKLISQIFIKFIQIIKLHLTILSQELIFNFFRKDFLYERKKTNLFILFSKKKILKKILKKVDVKKKFCIFFSSPYPSIKERKKIGKIPIHYYFKSYKYFFFSSFLVFQKKPTLKNLLHSLNEFLSAEKFFIFLLIFQIKKNNSEILKIFTTYENLPRENIIIKNFKNEIDVVGIIHSPIFNLNRGNVYRIKNCINMPAELYFLYQEKYLAFKKNFNLKKIKYSILSKRKKFTQKFPHDYNKKNIILFPSFYDFSNNFFSNLEIFLSKEGLKVYTKYHHENKKFSYQHDTFVNRLLKNKKNLLLISCSLTNAGFYYAINGYDVIIKSINNKLYNPYKYINFDQITQNNNIYKKILNFKK